MSKRRNRGQSRHGYKTSSSYDNSYDDNWWAQQEERRQFGFHLPKPKQQYKPLTAQEQAVKAEFLMGKFYIAPDVMVKFAEYARAAIPNEIGGYCRVKKNGDSFIAVDLKVFPQTANGGFFQMDGMEIAKWRKQMVKEGRQEESKEWNCLIHSHPVGTAPFLSGTDRDQIIELGCRRHFWSIIMTSAPNIAACDWRVHFYHGGDTPFLVQDIPVDTFHPEWKSIREEVKAAQGSKINFVGRGSENGSRPGLNGTPLPAVQPVSVTANGAVTNFTAKSTNEELVRELAESGVWLPGIGQVADPSEDLFKGITEGSIVTVDITPEELSQWSEEVQEQVIEMVGQEFSVEEINEQTGMLVVEGVEFAPDDLELVQD